MFFSVHFFFAFFSRQGASRRKWAPEKGRNRNKRERNEPKKEKNAKKASLNETKPNESS